jgi:glycerol-3-phosphate acyltransferase PlsY
MLELGIKTLIAYLLGSVSGGLLVGQLRGGIDIRKLGSGNAGGTNALRTQGLGFAFWVMVIDIGKGILATTWVASAPFVPPEPAVDRLWLAVACATAVVIGHVYPIWYGFRGGKGAATLVGVLVGLQPIALLPVLATWLVVVMLSGFVSLATMLACASYVVFLLVCERYAAAPLLAFGIVMTLFVCYTHRSNIARLRTGNENRVKRLWLLRPR